MRPQIGTAQEVDVEVVRRIATGKPSTRLVPRKFFVARSGVLTVAFRGFSPTLLAIKKEVAAAFPSIRPELPGSRWPKITLAALVPNKQLALLDVFALMKICAEWDQELQLSENTLLVDHVNVVHYRCRSLEERIDTHSIRLSGLPPEDEDPPSWHREQVDRVLRQLSPERLDEYLPHVCRVERDIRHYRRTHEGSSLVISPPEDYLPFIAEFARRVDERLPGYYGWIGPSYRHITLRTLSSSTPETGVA